MNEVSDSEKQLFVCLSTFDIVSFQHAMCRWFGKVQHFRYQETTYTFTYHLAT